MAYSNDNAQIRAAKLIRNHIRNAERVGNGNGAVKLKASLLRLDRKIKLRKEDKIK